MARSIARFLSPLLLGGLLALPAMAQSMLPAIEGNRASIGAAQIQHFLDAAGPQHYDTLGGLLALSVSNPQVSIPAGGQRLRLAFDAAAATAGGAPVPIGRLVLASGLRYDAGQRALLLDQPTLDEVQPARAGQHVDARMQGLINLWLADYARSEPLYRIDDATAALLGDLQVESTTIEDGRVVVSFNRDIAQALGTPDE
ncbi:DUF1439 domain-containing protein [Pseudoxanthomonas mexicana]|uniref:DUF1439 domain-containing protein n=1 Tax=Pseudoxanthomonas mexicana TaxID=128785 RepID=UPI00398A83AC